MARQHKVAEESSPAEKLEELVQHALKIAKKARRHRQNLANDNYYGNKLAELRADASNLFRELASRTLGDTTALAELTDVVFAASTPAPDRLRACQELTFSLRTTWKEQTAAPAVQTGEGIFPLAILVKANRGYLVTIGRQMNGCFEAGWHDACAVMMRRLVEILVIESFESKAIADRIKDGNGDYVQLTALIDRALQEPAFALSRNAKSALPQLRDLGHRSAHGRYFTAQPHDIERLRSDFRVVVEEFLHHAGLL